ncbi:DNA polymerase III subunit psi [Polynucleobacter sp. 15G-AUS-farblos]|uniref:DNA polymerase III subunit psi n=1 Tax=Polynucleobacter sp. 15G-AUS-farblos TaxID=2689094 RepID=UPI001C0B644E|nr:DNA polymerase III subunit psi [Polynucleobacter sp. 15G-AUS-farblos]MBU3582400.1 DNA polymerase III subunit psi [Polynucleobacter sp. 15G-AUS-farblos]
MSNSHSSFLKEMGITEWISRESAPVGDSFKPIMASSEDSASPRNQEPQVAQEPRFFWWFIGDQTQGDAQLLFQNIVRVLGLGPQEWSWLKPSEKLNMLISSAPEIPVVALVFGGPAAQKITGERDSLPQLRETVLAIDGDGLEDIPVVATFDLSHLLSKPKDKALLWQDLLLAKSVLQSL